MKKITLLIICIAGFVFAGWVKIHGTSESPLPPKKVVMASDSLFVFIRNENFGFIKEDTTVDLENFQRIKIPDEPIDYDTTNIGKPEIPYVRLLIAVPDSVEFNIRIYPLDYTLFEDYHIYPVPQIVFETDTSGCICCREVFTYDNLFYQKDTIYPGKFYEIKSDGHWRDQRVLEVFLYPVQFNPQNRLMYFYNSMDVRVEYVGEVVENTNGLGPFEELGQEMLLNYPAPGQEIVPENGIPPHPPSVYYYTDLLNPDNVADYLIVTHGDFLVLPTGDSIYEPPPAARWINDFAQWRVDHNKFDVGIVKMEDIYAQFPESLPDSAAVLRQFLKYAYDNWRARHIPDGHFAYCLFIGDWDYVPIELRLVTYSGDPFWNAYEGYFRDLTSDNMEDIMLGRWPVKINPAHYSEDLAAIAQKTINYEQNPALGAWRRRGFVIGGPGPGYWSFCDPNIDEAVVCFSDINYDTFTVRCPDMLYPTIFLFRDSVHKYLNRGEIIAAFYGHGGYNGWGGTFSEHYWYRSWSAETLQNCDSLSVVLSYACCPGSFHWDHPCFDTIFPDTINYADSLRICLGDAFLNNPNGGAVAFYGATSPIWMSQYNTEPTERILRHQEWILGKALVNTTANTENNCFCLLGDPALDLGDYTAYPNLPDLVVRPQGIDIELLSPSYPYLSIDDTIPVKAKIWNIGGTPADNVEVEFTVNVSDTTQTITFPLMTIPELLPRDSAVVTVYWYPSANFPDYYGVLGDCEFSVEADPDNKIDESWPDNNTSSITSKVVIYPHQPGWPKQIIGCKQPAIANLDGNGPVEIVCPGLDSIYVFDINGDNSDGWPQYFREVHSVVLGDINNDNKVEIIATALGDTVKVYNWQGDILWAREIPDDSSDLSWDINRSPSLGRIADATSPYLDVVIIGDAGFGGPDDSTRVSGLFKVFVYNYNGDLLYAFPSDSIVLPVNSVVSFNPPSIADINGDGKQEIVISSIDPSGNGFTTIFNKDGLVNRLYYGNSRMTPALAKVDGDNYPEIIIGGASNDRTIRAYNAVTHSILWETPTGGAINSSPAVGNINPLVGFAGNEIAFGNDAFKIFAIKNLHGDWWDPWPLGTGGMVRTSAALANMDNNSGLDIVIGSNDQYIYALKHDGLAIPPFPLPVFGLPSSPIIGDIDGDTKNEIILASSDGYLHVWKTLNSNVSAYRLEWPQFHHDYQRTGLYGWPLTPKIKVSLNLLSNISASTTISFSLEEKLYTQIIVYNAQGKPVRTLKNQELSTGDYKIDWDGTDDNHKPVPNGSYIIEFKCEDGVETSPVVIKW